MHKAKQNISLKRHRKTISYFIGFEAVAFFLAALIHKGFFIQGYMHYAAGVAETVITGILVAGLLLSWLQTGWARTLGLAVQGLAFLGTSIGIATIIIGIGPSTLLDIVYHGLMLAVLGAGIYLAMQLPRH